MTIREAVPEAIWDLGFGNSDVEGWNRDGRD
jgi:hypothetical protein